MIAVLTHMGLELSGQGVWLCVRGRCTHKHHRCIGDLLLMLALAIVTVRLVG